VEREVSHRACNASTVFSGHILDCNQKDHPTGSHTASHREFLIVWSGDGGDPVAHVDQRRAGKVARFGGMK